MSSGPDFASDGTTLMDILSGYEADGYAGQAAAVEGGLVRCFSCHEDAEPTEVHVDALRRIEGASDPDDMAAIVAFGCPRCGTKATLVLKFGPDASPEECEVLGDLDERERLTGADRSFGGVGAGGGGLDTPHDIPG
ncbi:MAG TPA: hypothetical protein VM030_01180 [Acidimicrobiales bacterium]|nr:hypothetical protein [Acidimicrobiales bacterium]